jgi:hypothetical protein
LKEAGFEPLGVRKKIENAIEGNQQRKIFAFSGTTFGKKKT